MNLKRSFVDSELYFVHANWTGCLVAVVIVANSSFFLALCGLFRRQIDYTSIRDVCVPLYYLTYG